MEVFLKTIDDEKRRLREHLELHFPGGVPRPKVGIATGGLVAPKTLANMGESGPPSYRVCGRVVYPVIDFVEWLFKDA
jgi:hypothetical protein